MINAKLLLPGGTHLVLLGMLLTFNWASSVIASPSSSIRAIVEQAKTKNLAQDDYWLRLVHYQRKGNGYQSQADDSDFFNAPDGKTSPVNSNATRFFSTRR